jgi:hypothetical protein
VGYLLGWAKAQGVWVIVLRRAGVLVSLARRSLEFECLDVDQ